MATTSVALISLLMGAVFGVILTLIYFNRKNKKDQGKLK